MQVANDVTSAKELPSREARPGRRVSTPLPESCRAASSARIASRALWSVVSLAESAAFVAYEASSAASALAPWSAVMLASRLASCAATKASVARPSRAFAILVSTSSGVSNPSTVESRAASALASRAAVVTASRRAAKIFEPTSEEVRRPRAGRTLSGRWRPPWRPAAPRLSRLGSRAWRPAPQR